ncbi:PQQ-dependent catabolism-associated beta-propeller protein [Azospirillum sp. HJ39]|uniref:PQQ-dependent catabolism-associated beta-propeller protein n=1 Tax=Azospirillum sp. HJ39 TaxID=3159496 RepID=UPI0035566173
MHLLRYAILILAAPALMAEPAASETIFVSNEKDNQIAVVDGDSLQITNKIKVGRRPRGITLSADGTQLYVCVGDDNRVDVVDIASGKVVHALPSGPDPELFVLSPDGTRLYVANEDDNMVTIIDIPSRKAIGNIQVGVEPEGMGISPDGKTLVNTSETTNMAHFIDTEKRAVVGNVLVDSRPRVARFTDDGKQVWVSSEIGGTVSVIDAATRKTIKKIRFEVTGVRREAIQAVGIQMTRDGTRAFVALGPANRIAEIDTASLEVKRYFLVGQRVWNLAFSPDEKRLYTTNGISNDLSVIDLERNKVIKSIPVGGAPWGVVVKQ